MKKQNQDKMERKSADKRFIQKKKRGGKHQRKEGTRRISRKEGKEEKKVIDSKRRNHEKRKKELQRTRKIKVRKRGPGKQIKKTGYEKKEKLNPKE